MSKHPKLSIVVLSVVVLSFSTATVAQAEPVSPDTSTTKPETTSPPTTTPVPTTTRPTTTTITPRPTTTQRTGSSTTLPGTPTTEAPGIPPTAQPQYEFAPMPNSFYDTVIPSASADPFFHAAKELDLNLTLLTKKKRQYKEAKKTSKKRRTEHNKAAETLTAAQRADKQATSALITAKENIRIAAMQQYVGHDTTGDVLDLNMDDAADSMKSKTYMASVVDTTKMELRKSQDQKRRSSAALDTAEIEEAATQKEMRKATTAEAKRKDERDDADLRVRINRLTLSANMDQISGPGLIPSTGKLPKLKKLPEDAIGVDSPVGTIVIPKSVDPRTALAMQYIVEQLGKPYIWGGTGPRGYDCSGLLLTAFQYAGMTGMPRVSQDQQQWATPVNVKDLQPGDFVFFGRPAHHVGIYIGGGMMINAPYTGTVVRVDNIFSTVTSYGRVRFPED